MAKNKISEWSSLASNNTDVGGIDIAEGCAPSGINNAIREVMAQVKDMVTGADGDSQTIGGNLSVTGTSTLTGAVTAPAGITGNLIGTVTGNITGNAGTVTNGVYTTGNQTIAGTKTFSSSIAGSITGNAETVTNGVYTVGNQTIGGVKTFSSNIVGNLTGNVTGNVTGNATTATTATNLSGTLTVANGGTGLTTLTANNVMLGNGTATPSFVAPSTSGNVLTSNGTTWTSVAPNSPIGVDQTWQDVTASRAISTTYTNSTGRPIQVSVSVNSTTNSGCYVRFYINGVVVARQGAAQSSSLDARANVSLIIPNGNTYKIENADQAGNNGQGQIALQTWFELR